MQFGPFERDQRRQPAAAVLARGDRAQPRHLCPGRRALREAQDDATLMALREQEDLGLDILTDGEQRRESFVYHAAATWDGIDMLNQPKRKPIAIAAARASFAPSPASEAGPGRACLDEVRFAKAIRNAPVKVAVAGPMTVIDSTLDEFYGTKQRWPWTSRRPSMPS